MRQQEMVDPATLIRWETPDVAKEPAKRGESRHPGKQICPKGAASLTAEQPLHGFVVDLEYQVKRFPGLLMAANPTAVW